MMAISPVLGATLALAFIYALHRLLSIGKRDSRLPPGPPTVPVLGNAHLIPTTGIGSSMLNQITRMFSLRRG